MIKRTRRHSLGQHFLADGGTLRKIVSVIQPGQGDLIIEIGGGKGALTLPLAEKAGQVICIEMDPELADHLAGLEVGNLKVISADALKVDFTSLAWSPRTKVAGNLPYSISSPLLFKIISERKNISFCAFLVQKEFALRICAKPGSKAFAPLSIMTDIYFERKIHFTVKPGAFSPPPRVDSALISLVKRAEPLLALPEEGAFLTFLQGCFSHRRKTLANNLKAMDFSSQQVETALIQTAISRIARAEQLDAPRFFDLMTALGSWKNKREGSGPEGK